MDERQARALIGRVITVAWLTRKGEARMTTGRLVGVGAKHGPEPFQMVLDCARDVSWRFVPVRRITKVSLAE